MKIRLFAFVFLILLGAFAVAEDKKPAAKPEFPAFDKVTDGMDVTPGFLTLYNKDEKLYGLVKNNQMGKPFLLAITITGGLYHGMQWDELLVQWELQDKTLLLVRPNIRYKAPKTTFENVIDRTYRETIIRALPVLSKGEGGVLVDLSDLFKSDLAGLNMISSFLLGGTFRMNPMMSKWSTLKAFPINTEIGVDVAFSGMAYSSAVNWTDSSDPGRTYKMGVHYSLTQLSKTSYQPRAADTRVGYFYTAIKDLSKGRDSRSQFDRYIHRWDLQKIDTSLEMSPPKKPIIFYIEKTVPYRYRRYVREGILEWNKAFEKLGFVDAVIVRQQTDTEFADLDPEDARYSFFRWVANGMSFAAGPSRVNPLTGEILDADIIFDDSMLRFAAQDFQMMKAMANSMLTDRKLVEFCEKFPNRNPLKQFVKLLSKRDAQEIERNQKFLQTLQQLNKPLCHFGHERCHQLALAGLIMKEDEKKDLSEEFVGQYLKEIVMHEVGHTLGLFHNFKASSWLPLAEINGADKPEAITGSVMDYNPINYAPKGKPQGNYVMRTIGPYDYWAIEYGYKIAKKSEELAEIASQTSKKDEKGRTPRSYGNDYYASMLDPDPHILRWDLGDDHMAYALQQVELADQLIKDILEKNVEKGEDFFPARLAFGRLLYQRLVSMMTVARYVGGVSLNWDHKGDPDARSPLELIAVKKQRDAMQFVAENMFSDKAFQFDPKLIQHLAPGTWLHWESDQSSETVSSLHQSILAFQDLALFLMTNPITLDRIHNSSLQLAAGEDHVTIAEVFDTMTNSIWSELDKLPENPGQWTNSNPFISKIRRNLQKDYLDNWIFGFVLDRWYPGFVVEDAKTQAWKNLHDLSAKIDNALNSKNSFDSASRAHLLEAKTRIQHALNANFIK